MEKSHNSGYEAILELDSNPVCAQNSFGILD